MKYDLSDLIDLSSDGEDSIIQEKPKSTTKPSSSTSGGRFSSSESSPSPPPSLTRPAVNEGRFFSLHSQPPASPSSSREKGRGKDATSRPPGRYGLEEGFGETPSRRTPESKGKLKQGADREVESIWTMGLQVERLNRGEGYNSPPNPRATDLWRKGVVSSDPWVDPVASPSSARAIRQSSSSPRLRSKPSTVGLPSPGRSPRTKQKEKEKEKERLVFEVDEWDEWDRISHDEAIRQAHSTSQTLSQALQDISRSTLRTSLRSRAEQQAKEAEEIEKMFREMELKKEQEDKRLMKEGNERQKGRWESINMAIEDAEKSAREELSQSLAREEAERLAVEAAEAERLAAVAAAAERAKKTEAEKVAKAGADRKAAAERAAKAEADRLAEEERAKRGSGEKFVDGRDVKREEWESWRTVMRGMKDGVIEAVKAQEELRKSLSLPKRELRKKVGMLRNDRDNIIKITNELHALLNQQLGYAPSISQPTQNLSELPIAYKWLLSHLCKTLIKQAENEVRAKMDAAFPLAKVVIGLLLRGHKELGTVLMARFSKKCCWVIPYYPDMERGQTMDNYRKSTGVKESDPPETTSQQIERLGGILVLYLAICCSQIGPLLPALPARPSSMAQVELLIPPYFRITACWSWLAGMLKGDLPTRNAASEMVSVGLETMGTELMEAFGIAQVAKVVFAIQREGLGQRGGDGMGSFAPDNVAGRERLKLLLEKVVDVKAFPVQASKFWEL